MTQLLAASPNPMPTAERYSHADIHLIRAPTASIIEHTWRSNHHAFGTTVALETYVAGLKNLDNQEFSGRKNHTIWILVPKTFNQDYEPDLDLILATAETYERPGLLATTQDGVKDVRAISVASVHTPERYRGNGYASVMMKLLWKEIQQMRHISFTFLYSAVGPTFYGRIGWAPKRSDEMLIPTEHVLPQAETDVIPPVVLQEITDQELPALLEQDAARLRQRMQTRLETASSKQTLVAPLPESNCVRWLLARARFTTEHILKLDQHQITAVGAKDSKSDSFVLWYPSLLEDKLFVLRWHLDEKLLRRDRDNTATALIKVLQQEAKKWKLSQAVIWNPEQSLADLAGLCIRYRYEKAIPSMGLVTSLEHDTDDVNWVLSEKYSWC
ncbi:hypothetical protein BGZ70_000240 [Mortierella alpina]|uniref:LYC1 C-terminal domain-containing protein n=1 Tax=Mortierella alpina TaxID=64518 RepID=A0A9P6JCS8_MORAP|nr:hypothetical protein BGZ70_000240 [Mortierella alpina]